MCFARNFRITNLFRKSEFTIHMGAERIEALSDGVFAIVMTLLVLRLGVPHIGNPSASNALLKGLLGMQSKIIAYVVSFMVLGLFWSLHQRQFNFIKRSDGIFIWANIFFLMVISLIPFSTALIGDYPQNRVAIIAYGSNLFAACQILLLQWLYATGRQRLVDPGISETVVRRNKSGLVVVSLAIVAAVLLSVVDARLSLGVFAVTTLVTVLYIMTRRYSIEDDL